MENRMEVKALYRLKKYSKWNPCSIHLDVEKDRIKIIDLVFEDLKSVGIEAYQVQIIKIIK
jgi:hypothetical protein